MPAPLPATQAMFQQVRDYYMENSFNVFRPTFTVSNLYTMPQPLASYGADCGTDVTCGDAALFAASTAAASADVSFPAFDHVMIYHAGLGQESTGNANDIWSLYIDENKTAGAKTFVGYTVVPQAESGRSAHGVICHEYGHQLGLPDLYNTVLRRSTVGKWDLMDYPYGPTAADTPHLGAWSKYFLGFSAPRVASGTVVLPPAETTRDAFLRIPHPAANETYFLEYRWRASPAAHDKGAPVSAGLAFWRVDESLLTGLVLANNLVNVPSINGHLGVDLIEADGIQSGGDFGNNDLFRDGETAFPPSTDGLGGAPSGFTASVVSGSDGPALTVNLVSFAVAPSVGIVRSINYPNPGGDPGRYPVRPDAAPGTVTTLVLQLSRPVSSRPRIGFDIHTFDGELVRTVPGECFSLEAAPGDPTSDGKWVYECDWDGMDEAGRPAASGVYATRARVDGEVKAGKLVLVR